MTKPVTKPATTKPATKKASEIQARIDACCKDVRDAVSTALNAREALANKLFALVTAYSKVDQSRLIEYIRCQGKREKSLQAFGDGIKGLLIPTWFNNPGLRGKTKRTLEEERTYRRGMAEEKVLSDTLPIVLAIAIENKAVEGVSCDRAAGTVVLLNADKATKSARVALGATRPGRKKGTTAANPSAETTIAATTTIAGLTVAVPATDGVAAQARDERAIVSANVTRLASELTARLSSKGWGELAESARDALLTLAALISERHNESEAAKARQQHAKAS